MLKCKNLAIKPLVRRPEALEVLGWLESENFAVSPLTPPGILRFRLRNVLEIRLSSHWPSGYLADATHQIICCPTWAFISTKSPCSGEASGYWVQDIPLRMANAYLSTKGSTHKGQREKKGLQRLLNSKLNFWKQLTKSFMLGTERRDVPTPTGQRRQNVGRFYMLAHFLRARAWVL